MKEFLTKKELAGRLKVSVRTIDRRLRENPAVATLNDGRTKRFCVEDYVNAVNRRGA